MHAHGAKVALSLYISEVAFFEMYERVIHKGKARNAALSPHKQYQHGILGSALVTKGGRVLVLGSVVLGSDVLLSGVLGSAGDLFIST
jgi:hypothetical protein